MKQPLRQLRSADAVIAAVGVGRLVEITGQSHSNVGNQRRDGRLAHPAFLVVTTELARLGYWAKPELWGIVSPKKPKKRNGK
jgi:hypothetical protein